MDFSECTGNMPVPACWCCTHPTLLGARFAESIPLGLAGVAGGVFGAAILLGVMAYRRRRSGSGAEPLLD